MLELDPTNRDGWCPDWVEHWGIDVGILDERDDPDDGGGDSSAFVRRWDLIFCTALLVLESDFPLGLVSRRFLACQRFCLMNSCMTCLRTWVELLAPADMELLSINWNLFGGSDVAVADTEVLAVAGAGGGEGVDMARS